MLVELLHSRAGLAKDGGVCRFPAGMQLSDSHPAAPLLLCKCRLGKGASME